MALNSDEGTVSRTSPSLLRAAQDNSPVAWRQIVDKYSRRIYRWCRQAGLQPDDASDVVQEVFRSVARKLIDFHHDQERDSFRGWLYTITKNKLRDHFGRRPGRLETAVGGTDAHLRFMEVAEVLTESAASHVPPDASRLDHQLIERARAEFSQRDWLLFWRVVVDGQTAQEAGEQFHMTSNAVRLVKMRVLRRLRELAAD